MWDSGGSPEGVRGRKTKRYPLRTFSFSLSSGDTTLPRLLPALRRPTTTPYVVLALFLGQRPGVSGEGVSQQDDESLGAFILSVSDVVVGEKNVSTLSFYDL